MGAGSESEAFADAQDESTERVAKNYEGSLFLITLHSLIKRHNNNNIRLLFSKNSHIRTHHYQSAMFFEFMKDSVLLGFFCLFCFSIFCYCFFFI